MPPAGGGWWCHRASELNCEFGGDAGNRNDSCAKELDTILGRKEGRKDGCRYVPRGSGMSGTGEISIV